MTTDVEVSAAGDLFAPNRVIQLPRISEAPDLAGIRFEARAGANESREMLRSRCFDVALKQLRAAWPTLTIWLFACHSAWQPKNRLSVHRRLWKSLEAASVVLPSGERAGEMQVETADLVRFFGVVGVPLDEAERAYQVINVEAESFLVGRTNGHAPPLDEDLVHVWHQHRQSELSSWSALAGIVCGHKGLLFRPFGFFDDVEVGVDVILEAATFRQWSATVGHG